MNARAQAIAARDAEIDASTQRAIASRAQQGARRMTAMESLSLRLGVNEQELTAALTATVFAGCQSKAQFLALVVVANEYRLNPLTKEIYAFPAKGGGVVPMVSVDGWIKLMNSHPAFDGIEFVYHNGKNGETVAVESIIYRNDRTRPIKVIEYLDECKRNTDPWNKSPRRMLRHRALIQGVRVAFGFTGVFAPEDEDVIDADYTVSTTQSLPGRDHFEQQQVSDQSGTEAGVQIDHDDQREPVTDSRGMTEVDEQTARELDAGASYDPDTGEVLTEEPQDEAERPAWWAKVESIRKGITAAKNKQHIKDFDDEYVKIRVGLPDDVIEELDALIARRRSELTRPRTEA